jgi:G:T-mismatch repair DNA endonuclease (very short patch repair protein)
MVSKETKEKLRERMVNNNPVKNNPQLGFQKGSGNIMFGKVPEHLVGDKNPMKNPETVKKVMENRRSYKGENNPHYGKKVSEETKNKIKEKVELAWKSKDSKYHTDEYKNNHSAGLTGRVVSDETKERISISKKGIQVLSDEQMASLSKNNIGRTHSDASKRRISDSLQGRRTLTDEQYKEIADKRRGIPRSEETKQRIRESHNNLWQDEEYLKMMAEARSIKPTKPEIKLGKLLQFLFPGEYKYTGDFQTWIGGKNPDFMNINGQKKLIEMFGDYWHQGEDENERINHFKTFGFNTLIIWESELKNLALVNYKLKRFHRSESHYLLEN